MRDTLLPRWTEIGAKVADLAEEFPEAHFDARPIDGSRTVAEHLRHVAFWNEWLREHMKGGSPDGSANEIPAERLATKREIVRALRASFDGVRDDLERNGASLEPAKAASLVSFIGYASEHYGQIVMHYRLHGLVPPASR